MQGIRGEARPRVLFVFYRHIRGGPCFFFSKFLRSVVRRMAGAEGEDLILRRASCLVFSLAFGLKGGDNRALVLVLHLTIVYGSNTSRCCADACRETGEYPHNGRMYRRKRQNALQHLPD